MTMRLVLAGLAASLLLIPTGSQADSRNVISHIQTGAGSGGAWVKIRGTQAPDFTQFKLSDPARVVIDVTGAVFAGPAAEIPVEGSVVRNVRTVMYQDGGASVARVTVELDEEVPYRIDASRGELTVALDDRDAGRRLARSIDPTSAAAERRAADAEARAREAEERLAEAQARMETERSAAEAAQRELESRVTGSERAVAELEAARAEARRRLEAAEAARAEAERRANELAAGREAALARADSERRAAEAARAEAERAATDALQARESAQSHSQQATERLARAQADAEAARAELTSARRELDVLRAEVQGRAGAAQEQLAARADLEKQAAAERERRERAEAQARAEAAARADAESRAREEAAARAAADARYQELRERGVVLADADGQMRAGARYAMAQYDTGDAGGAREGGGIRVSSRAKVMSLVGFQQMQGVSRVFIRTNEPARYTVNESGDEIWVELENTRARTMNDLNHLDTRFFDTAIEMIDPEEIAGAGTHVRIRIRLKQRVPYEVNRSNNEIHLDFRRPG